MGRGAIVEVYLQQAWDRCVGQATAFGGSISVRLWWSEKSAWALFENRMRQTGCRGTWQWCRLKGGVGVRVQEKRKWRLGESRARA